MFNDKRRVIIGEKEWLMQALGLRCPLSISLSEDFDRNQSSKKEEMITINIV